MMEYQVSSPSNDHQGDMSYHIAHSSQIATLMVFNNCHTFMIIGTVITKKRSYTTFYI